MLCPKCGMKMSNKEYCFHCGYMLNGNYIDTKKKIPPSILELYFGEYYDKYSRNENWFVAGILGPTYIFCHGHYFIGLLLIILDSFVSLFFLIFNHSLLFYYMILLLNNIYWFCNRLLWATIGNMIYLKLKKAKLSKIKNKHYDYFQAEIRNMYSKDNKLIILKYFIFGILFLIIFLFIKKLLYDKIGLL